jgi:hypothetical protein
MPKENTHLFFAKMLCDDLTGKDYGSRLHDNRKAFYLGCVFPDAFFYHPRKDVEAVSKKLHDIGDQPYEIIDDFVSEARKQNSYCDLAFAMGYLSHLSLDRIFHPVIDRICKDENDRTPDKQEAEEYRHRLLETSLDRQINKTCFVTEMIDIYQLSTLISLNVLSQRVGVSENELKAAFVHQHKINKLFMKKWAYLWARLLKKLGKSSYHSILPLFYAHLKKEHMAFPQEFIVSVSENGKQEEESINGLLKKAEALAEKLFDYTNLVFNDTDRSIRIDSSKVRQIFLDKL